jgi:hypothetical protein
VKDVLTALAVFGCGLVLALGLLALSGTPFF